MSAHLIGPLTVDLPFDVVMLILGFVGRLPPMHPIMSSILRKHLDQRLCARCGEYKNGNFSIDRVYCLCTKRPRRFIDKWKPSIRPIVLPGLDCTNIHSLSPTRYRLLRKSIRCSVENAVTMDTCPIRDQFYSLELMIRNLEINNRCIRSNRDDDDPHSLNNQLIAKFAGMSIEERYSTKRFIIISPRVSNPPHIIVSDLYPHTIDICDRPICWEDDARKVFRLLSFHDGHDPLGLLPPPK